MAKKKILDKVQGLPKVKISDLVEFQGELKKLSDEGMARLKAQLLKNHFFAPVYAWKSRNGVYYLLDGHQRIKALQELEKEGHGIPEELSVLEIAAASKKDAKGKLLALSSQYAKVTRRGLEKFLDDANLDIELLANEINIAGVEIEVGGPVLGLELGEGKQKESPGKVVHTCPECGYSW